DAFVDSVQPGNNYGLAGLLGIAPLNEPKGEFDSFVEFDLSTTKSAFDAFFGTGHWAVQSISLRLTATPPNNVLFNGSGVGNTAGKISIRWLQNDAWLEGSGKPSAPDADPGDLNFDNHGNYLSAADECLGVVNLHGS